jgi:GNAT superfamily N-acetyltransferase
LSTEYAFDDQYALAENHFAFMGAQRGTLHRRGSSIELEGRADFLSWWTPLIPDAEVPESATMVRLFPWSHDSWPPRLLDLGFRPAGELSYMDAPVQPGGQRPLPDDVTITVVASDADADAFAETQEAGFRTPEDADEDSAWWLAFLTEEARRNYADPAQTFYLLRYAGAPAAVSLTVTTEGICGVYEVATLPAYRGRGYASLLLDRIRVDAYARGDDRLTLQVWPDSIAERFYLKAGFRPSFVSAHYER